MNDPEHEPWTHEWAQLDSIVLHYVEAGDPDDPLVVLLHGFPEFWYAWRNQIDSLAAAGFHIVAPDLRGYNRSEKPSGVGSYRLDRLVDDVVELVDHFGVERANIVGHDWGGVIAWELGHRRPDRLDRLAVLNAPHPEALERELRSPAQLARSWYALFFQLPQVPEAILGRTDGWLGALLRTDPSNPTAFDESVIERYEHAISRPGALTAAIDYYRAFGRSQLRRWVGLAESNARHPTIEAETLVIWGEQDRALGTELLDGLDRWVPDVRIERLPEASHWVQNDASEPVTDLLEEFLK
ncbi:alpha/beta fold hydrolase [Halococcus thailandensis]|uniref:Epoxide hydrolase n=1 Tax=Halococcus thailandensis JCM 13552 TaxID=1227457 RepID=M0N8K0_9EURY|nr:alpha/beta hydrolase [Halococcus thailandensis]EMA52970.1 epoxide hydrolase [Halococcus thailandensis JCM 13552]